MIQRIQTIYLLIAALAVGATLILPLSHFLTPSEQYSLYAVGLRDAGGELAFATWYMFAALLVSALLPIIIILIYSNRMLQIRLCVVEGVLLLGSIIIIGVHIFLSCRVFSTLETSAYTLCCGVLCPIVAMTFTFLAARAIFSDELLVRSVDRIR